MKHNITGQYKVSVRFAFFRIKVIKNWQIELELNLFHSRFSCPLRPNTKLRGKSFLSNLCFIHSSICFISYIPLFKIVLQNNISSQRTSLLNNAVCRGASSKGWWVLMQKSLKTCTLLKKTSQPLQAAAFVSLKWVGFNYIKCCPRSTEKFDGGFWEAV